MSTKESYFQAALTALEQADASLRTAVSLFKHSHLIGDYDDDEVSEPHDELYYERKTSDEVSTKESLPF